jgi:UDP-sulfoquinovose synthase
VLNRMVIQAVLGVPLTVYGKGGQTRGMLNIEDTVECIRLASENPAEAGEFRVFNQFTESMSVLGIAETIQEAYPGEVTIDHVENPRVESEEHYFKAAHTKLIDLGLQPHLLSDTLIDSMFAIAERYKDVVNLSAVQPTVKWRATASELAGSN